MTTQPLQILIVDDSAVIRQVLKQLLELDPHFKVCGQAWDTPSTMNLLASVQPDLVLVDISLDSKEGGIELIKLMRGKYAWLRILAISLHDAAVYAERVVKAGGDGYLMKQHAAEDLSRAIDKILKGEKYFPEDQILGSMAAVKGTPEC